MAGVGYSVESIAARSSVPMDKNSMSQADNEGRGGEELLRKSLALKN